jgi:hypothetical protein
MTTGWLTRLLDMVEKKPLVLLRFEGDEWQRIVDSRRGVSEFTVARPHDVLGDTKPPTACIVSGRHEFGRSLYFGLLSSKQAVTTLDSRIKVKRTVCIEPATETDLLKLVDGQHVQRLKDKLESDDAVVTLTPKLSSALVGRLAAMDSNRGGMRAVSESLSVPKRYGGSAGLQEDATRLALRAFGLAAHERAVEVELVGEKETSLARVAITEDAVIEHDARSISGYEFVGSDLTGRAVFRKDKARLEVFTANRRRLEHVFGVDLVYVNREKSNVVMVQYKMLEAVRQNGRVVDWIYRPDDQFDQELRRMRFFARREVPGVDYYRLNPSVFYLKFVKRDALLGKAGILLPLEHYDDLIAAGLLKGARGGIRLSFETLGGHYLRQRAFLDLVRTGYIGSPAETSAHLAALVDAIVRADKSIVLAIQEGLASDGGESSPAE